MAFPVLGGPENALAEEAVPLGLQGAVVDVQVLDAQGNPIELREDEDAMDTFNLARMDADDERR